MDIGAVIGKYIELRDRKAALVEKQKEEGKPINDAMEKIENWLMHQMNESGVDSLKANGVGTAFKANATSCQLQDAVEFKKFAFYPVVQVICDYMKNSGYNLRDVDCMTIMNIVRDMPMWDVIDFRASKKGITEYIANENAPVPGVAVNTIATINVRRA